MGGGGGDGGAVLGLSPCGRATGLRPTSPPPSSSPVRGAAAAHDGTRSSDAPVRLAGPPRWRWSWPCWWWWSWGCWWRRPPRARRLRRCCCGWLDEVPDLTLGRGRSLPARSAPPSLRAVVEGQSGRDGVRRSPSAAIGRRHDGESMSESLSPSSDVVSDETSSNASAPPSSWPTRVSTSSATRERRSSTSPPALAIGCTRLPALRGAATSCIPSMFSFPRSHGSFIRALEKSSVEGRLR